ncbi:ABC transporter substrate-binding protein [Salinibius halmophilus]|uniref:ABC transporter substrate-binding protein n=1 Tax=Salinibius halmophilus TaxID=1853216 RepID=UPI000E66450E|nr:extracellular solute-binding protein [Salinibius halmophilus]
MRLLKTTVAAVTAVASLATAQAALADETVKFWTFREQETALWDRINAENLIPGVTVEMERISSEDYESRLRIALRQGGPDFFGAKSGVAWYDPFVGADALLSIDELGVDISGMNGTAGVVASDGVAYAVPSAIQLQSVIYNGAVLEELGAEVPTTLAEFEALMADAVDAGFVGLHVDGRDGWYLNQVMNEVVMAGMVSDDTQRKLETGEACFTDAEVVAAFDKVVEWRDIMNANPTATDYGGMRTPVVLGDSLAMIDGAWTTGVWVSQAAGGLYDVNPDFVPEYGPIPGPNGKVVAHPDGGYAVNANTEKRDAVKAVLEFTTTAKFAQLFLEEIGSEIPAYAGDYDKPEGLHPIVGKISAQMANAAAYEPFLAPSLNAKQPTYGSLSAQAYQGMLAGDLSGAEAAALIQEGLNSWNYVGAGNCQ